MNRIILDQNGLVLQFDRSVFRLHFHNTEIMVITFGSLSFSVAAEIILKYMFLKTF